MGRLDIPGYRLGMVIGGLWRTLVRFFAGLFSRRENTEIAWEDGEVEDSDKQR